ncbi:MAG: hypothetical protein H6833_09420 [Planctomycetes bacterium]|nr:hypothetical protein [Planctomycetota bacterium]
MSVDSRSRSRRGFADIVCKSDASGFFCIEMPAGFNADARAIVTISGPSRAGKMAKVYFDPEDTKSYHWDLGVVALEHGCRVYGVLADRAGKNSWMDDLKFSNLGQVEFVDGIVHDVQEVYVTTVRGDGVYELKYPLGDGRWGVDVSSGLSGAAVHVISGSTFEIGADMRRLKHDIVVDNLE